MKSETIGSWWSMVADGSFRRDGERNGAEENKEVRGEMGLSLSLGRRKGEEWEMGVKCVR